MESLIIGAVKSLGLGVPLVWLNYTTSSSVGYLFQVSAGEGSSIRSPKEDTSPAK